MPSPDQPEVTTPSTWEARRNVATMCVEETNLDVFPTLVDDLADTAARAYAAAPDRLYVIARGGVIAYQGRPGPFGFDPYEWEAAIRGVLETR